MQTNMGFKMSERLKTILNEKLITKGMKAIVDGSGLSRNTIYEIADGRRVPHRGNAYKLALACGCSPGDALTLARECIRMKAKKAS